MRVCAGRYKGLPLGYPRSGLRPTKDVTRQAIFNMLGDRVIGARVLDLFAGAGSLGIEALSRGALSAVLVERSAQVLRFLRRNVEQVAGATVVRGDVLNVLTGLGRAGFDVILADPPYRQRLVQQTVERVAELGLLAEDGVFVGEHHRDEDLTAPAGWQVPKRGRYGDSRVTMMTNRGLPTAAVEQE